MSSARFPAALLLAASVIAPLPCAAQTVLQRVRLGNEIEDLEVVPSGRYANQVAIMDGLTVTGIPAMGHGHHGRHRLFDVERLDMLLAPRGIAYVESERLFVFNEPAQLDTLFFSDDEGNPAGTREITWPAGFVPGHSEALTYIPRGARWHPDTIAGAFYDEDFASHVLVLSRDGVVIDDLYVDDPVVQENGLVGLAWSREGDFLGTTSTPAGNEMLRIDLAGHVVARVSVREPGLRSGLEGIGERANGSIVTACFEGLLYGFGRDLSRAPGDDADVREGVGLSHVLGPSWDPLIGRFLFIDGFASRIASVPTTFDSADTLIDLAAAGYDDPFQVRDVFHDPSTGGVGVSLLGVGTPYPPGLALFDHDGAPAGFVAMPAGILPQATEPLGASGQYAIAARRRVNNGQLRVVDSTGALVRSIDLRPVLGTVPLEAAYFEPPAASPRLLVLSPVRRDAVVAGLDGSEISRFDYVDALHAPHGAYSPTAITSGPFAGAFATVAFDTNELIVFTLE